MSRGGEKGKGGAKAVADDNSDMIMAVRQWYDASMSDVGDRLGFETSALGRDFRLVEAEPGFVEFTMPVERRHTNSHGTLHGGCIASLIDVVGSAAIMTRGPRRHVSTDINISYQQATNIGDILKIRGTCSRAGGRIAFSEVVVLREAKENEVIFCPEGKLLTPESIASKGGTPHGLTCVARGRHTKYILKSPLPSSRL